MHLLMESIHIQCIMFPLVSLKPSSAPPRVVPSNSPHNAFELLELFTPRNNNMTVRIICFCRLHSNTSRL